MVYVILLLVQVNACEQYMCTTNHAMTIGDQILDLGRTHEFKSCSSGQICAEEKCAPSPIGLAYPGEQCGDEIQCAVGVCSAGLCEGLTQDERCVTDSEANPGYYCSNGIVRATIPTGKTGCSRDTMCSNTAGCNYGKCTKYMSVKAGDSVSTCENGVSMLCASNICYEKMPGYYACGGAVSSLSSPSSKCMPIFPCQSELDDVTGQIYNKTCQVFNEEQYFGQCPLFPGDALAQDLISLLRVWIDSGALNICNGTRRFHKACIDLWADIDSEWDSKIEQEDGALTIMSVETCVKEEPFITNVNRLVSIHGDDADDELDKLFLQIHNDTTRIPEPQAIFYEYFVAGGFFAVFVIIYYIK